MIDFADRDKDALPSVSCSAALRRSTFELRRIADAVMEERMHKQREARLQALHARTLPCADRALPDARFPRRWTDE